MDAAINSQQLVRLLADEKRHRIVAALVLADGALTASEVAEASGLSLRDVVDSAVRLVAGGLIDGDTNGYSLIAGVFQSAARAEAPPTPPSEHGDQPDDVARVLDLAFKNGKLVQWPAKHSKRLIVLDHLAQQFDIGKRYNEAEVNARLKPFNEDVAMSRRYLVDEQFLDRAEGEYWRCGGSF